MFLAIAKLRKENGGQGRNRTADAGLFRAALYQLSYLAKESKKRRSIGTRANACQLTLLRKLNVSITGGFCRISHKKSLTDFLRGV